MNTTSMNVKNDTVLDVIANLSKVSKDELKPETELVADLGIDSPKALQLLVELEEALEIEISDEEAAKLESVGDILELCAQK